MAALQPTAPSEPLQTVPASSTQQDTPHDQQQGNFLKHTPQEGSAEGKVKETVKDDEKKKKDKKDKKEKKEKKPKEKDDSEKKKSKKEKDKGDLEAKTTQKDKKADDLEAKNSNKDQDKHEEIPECQVKVKKEIGTPIQKPKGDEPEFPCDVVVAATGSSGSTGDGEASLPSSSSKKSSSVPGAPQHGLDITQNFLEETKEYHDEEEASTKDMFLSADLIVPGIALKKFTMYLASDNHSLTDSKFAMLGVGEVRKYRTERKCLEGMVLADTTKMAEGSWVSVSNHLENKGLKAIFIASGSAVSLAHAAWTTKCLNWVHVYLKICCIWAHQ